MIYVKSVLAGIAGALLASIGWIVVSFILPIAVPILLSRFSNEGAGGSGAVIGSGSILLAALLGFIAGFYWQFRRAKKS